MPVNHSALLTLEGAAAGVQVINTSGQPGENAKIRIRGIGSFSASSAPLYVVDGMPYDEESVNALNPADIESMSISDFKVILTVCLIATSCVAIPIKETTKVFAELTRHRKCL